MHSLDTLHDMHVTRNTMRIIEASDHPQHNPEPIVWGKPGLPGVFIGTDDGMWHIAPGIDGHSSMGLLADDWQLLELVMRWLDLGLPRSEFNEYEAMKGLFRMSIEPRYTEAVRLASRMLIDEVLFNICNE